MKIKNFEIFKYNLPLHSPLLIKQNKMYDRQGCVIQIGDNMGNVGLGETAPFPGLHRENLEMCVDQLNKLKRELINQDIPEKIELLNGKFDKWLFPFSLFPSVRFGFETAILNLIARMHNTNLFSLFSENPQKKIKINGLATGYPSQIVEHFYEQVDQGFKTIKLKIGWLPIEEAIELVSRIGKESLGKIQLRLDANSSWSIADAVKFDRSIDPGFIEYIEEPLKNFSYIQKFLGSCTLPLALDENLSNISINELKKYSKVKAFVLKPSVLGGFERCKQISNEGAKIGIYAVISSAFQSSIGLGASANFAASLNPGNIAMGFDTLRLFRSDVLNEPVCIKYGEIDLKKNYKLQKSLNQNVLTQI